MNTTEMISFVPVVDRQDVWNGIWIRFDSNHNRELGGLLTRLFDLPLDLKVFLSTRDFSQFGPQEGLPPEKICLIFDEADSSIQAPQGRDRFRSVIYGRQFVTGIADQSQYEAAIKNGAEWFVGDYVSHPPFRPGTTPDAGKAVVMQLMGLVADDAENSEIEKVFKHDPSLSFHLFRLVNSVSMGLSTKVTSFNQALTIIGRRQLARWLQILLYVSHQGKNSSPKLMQLAAMRGRLMEQFSIAIGWNANMQDQAFMTGMFSLLDGLLGMPVEEVAKMLQLPDAVKAALLSNEGGLGQMLALIEKSQSGADEVLPLVLADLDPDRFCECQLDALSWSLGLGQENTF